MAAAAAAAAAGGSLNRANAASDEAADNAQSAPVAGQEARTPPRQQSPIHRHYNEQEDGADKWSRAGNVVAEKAGGGGGGGFGASTGSVASSIGRWEIPTTQASQQQPAPSAAPAPAPSAAAAGGGSDGVFAYAGGGSSSNSGGNNKVAARPPPSAAPSDAPASSTTTTAASSEPGSIAKSALPSTAGGALRRIPPSGKTSSSGDVSTLPPAANAADTRASAPVRAPSPLRSGGLQVQSLGAEASEMFSAEAVTPTGPPSAELLGSGRTPRSAGAGSGVERGAAEGAVGGTSVAARVVTWPPASPAPGGRAWPRRTEVVFYVFSFCVE